MGYLFKQVNLEKNDAIIQFGNSLEVDRFIEFDLFKGQTTDRLELERQLLNDPKLEVEKTTKILSHLFEMHEYLAISNKHEVPTIPKKKLIKQITRPTGYYYGSQQFKLAITESLNSLSKSKSTKLNELYLVGDYYTDYTFDKSLISDDHDFLYALSNVSTNIRINLIDFDFQQRNWDLITQINSTTRKVNPIIIFNITKDIERQQYETYIDEYREATDD